MEPQEIFDLAVAYIAKKMKLTETELAALDEARREDTLRGYAADVRYFVLLAGVMTALASGDDADGIAAHLRRAGVAEHEVKQLINSGHNFLRWSDMEEAVLKKCRKYVASARRATTVTSGVTS